MKKGWIAILTVTLLIMSLSSCGSADTKKETADNHSAAASVNSSHEAAETGAVADEDIAQVNMIYFSMGAIPSGLSVVEDELNKITEEKIGVHVNIEMIETGNYAQQVGLKAASREKLDLMLTPPIEAASFNNMAAQNQLMDITDLLQDYGQDTLDIVGELINSTTKDGKIIGVPCYRSLVTSLYIFMRTDVLEDLGLLEKAQKMTSLAEYEEILQAVKDSEKWSHMAGIVASDGQGTGIPVAGVYAGTDNFSDATTYDQLGDAYKIVAIRPDGSDTTVLNNFATEDYKAMWARMKNWYDKGYVYKDIITAHDMAEQLVKSDVAFSYFGLGEAGVETTKSTACGMPMTCVKVLTLPIDTYNSTKFTWAVPSSATEPEAAVKLLNLMYTSKEVANLLAWGIEGVDYVVNNGVATFPEGIDQNNCAYHTADFLYGNQFNVLPWEGQSSDFRTITQQEMAKAPTSAYLGFSCDTTAVQSEIAAVSNVLGEYRPSIDSGVASESDYQAFLDKMEASGLQKIINEFQSQLNEWLEQKNN